MDHQAFAQLLGNYGEFLGAIAVVVTLIYLALQIRQNTKTMNAAAHSERTNRNIQLTLWGGEHGLTNIVRRREAGDTISEAEEDMLLMHSIAVLRHFEDLHYQKSLGVVDDETWAANLSGITRRAAIPGFEEVYNLAKYGLRRPFRQLVEKAMSDPGG